jgi:PAS domain S-box-containing protein
VIASDLQTPEETHSFATAILDPRHPATKALWVIGFAAIYFIFSIASIRTFWLPCGWALGAFLLMERRSWPMVMIAIATGEGAYNYFGFASTWPWWANAVLSTSNVAAALAGAWIVQRVVPRSGLLHSVPRLVGILCLGSGVALAPTSAAGTFIVQLMGSKRDFATIATAWYLRDLLGVLLITPLVLAWLQPIGLQDRAWDRRRQLEASLLLLGLIAVLLSTLVAGESHGLLIRIAVIPFVLWAGLRFGTRGITAISLITGLSLGWLALKGYGLSDLSASASTVRAIAARNLDLQITLASMAFFGLIPAIIVQAQRRAEQALRAERNFSRATLDHAPVSVLVVGLEGDPLQINRSGLNLLEAADLNEVRTRSIPACIQPAYRQKYLTLLRRVAEGTDESLVFELQNGQGNIRTIEGKSVPLRNEHNQIYGVLHLWRDITEARRIEADLEVARFTVDHATVPMIWSLHEGLIVDTNQAARQLLGYSEEELKQLRLADLMQGDDSAEKSSPLQSGLSRPATTAATTMRRKQGETLEVEVRTQYLHLNQGSTDRELVCTFILDVTKQKRAEEILRRSQARLSLIFEAVAEGIIVHDGNGQLIDFNPAAARMFGIARDEMFPRTAANPGWQLIQEEQRPSLPADDPSFFSASTGRPMRGAIRGLVQADGTTRWFSISTEPLLSASGDVTMVVSSFSDITAERSLSNQLRHSQKMEVIGQLAGGIAHDFNNILTAMILNLEMLERAPQFPRSGRPIIDNIKGMTKRASGLTEQLLLFARRRVVQMKAMELNANIQSLAKILGPSLGEKAVLNHRLDPAGVWVEGDAGMIDQIVMNLCLNSRDAMPAGGTVTIETGVAIVTPAEAEKNQFPGARAGRFAFLRVIDTGTGIPPALLARIFEPFFTTKEPGQGTGLGLATVHGIVMQHNGWISVASIIGKGATFTVYLPTAVSFQAVAAPVSASPAAASATILLVEDEPAVRMVCSMLLREIGYHVLEADCAPRALELWQEHCDEVDLLITDVVMPEGMSGHELVTELRQTRPDLRVIVISGYNDEIIKAEQLISERITLLTKPFGFEALASTVRGALPEPIAAGAQKERHRRTS